MTHGLSRNLSRGLYGKLPGKRDFIALGVPRAVLAAYEPWLQAGLAASRVALGARWQAAYLRAPIWRFWLGPELCGAPALGALMPSVDGVGRYFPLTLVASGDGLAPPDREANAAWFERVDALLLGALDAGRRFEDPGAALAALPDPARPEAAPDLEGLVRIEGGLIAPLGPDGLGATVAALRRAQAPCPRSTLWWTEGGEGFPPRVLSARGLPAAYAFATFLSPETAP